MTPSAPDKLALLQKYFGFTSFRPIQEAVINHVSSGGDAFVLMPTGGGKSLCYQLPALMFSGITVVVSPLIALMKDQVDSLLELGIPATFLNSSISSEENSARLSALFKGKYKLLYLAPERLMTDGFIDLLSKLSVSLFAIDEAHCISEWGHDFRPEYRELKDLRKKFPAVPLIALTATATTRVQEDIVRQLAITKGKLFKASFVRKNLFYDVRPKQNSYAQILEFLRAAPDDSGIIYCSSRTSVETLAEKLKQDKINALAYHAGMSADERSKKQDDFIRDDVQIMVATIAFGMGIDKPNVRFVIHYDLPRNLEGYYQETGRAGRDGLDSTCVLFYSYGDRRKIEFFLNDKPPDQQEIARAQLTQVLNYAESAVCRHKLLANYFGESFTEENCGRCDNCTKLSERIDATVPAQKFLSCVKRTGERFGAMYVIDVLRGGDNPKIFSNGHSKLTTYGIGKDLSQQAWLNLSRQLIGAEYLTLGDYNVLRLADKSAEILFQGKPFLAKPLQEKRATKTKKSAVVQPERVDESLFTKLRRLRKELADAQRVPPYVIFSDATLKQMSAEKPRSLDAMNKIAGIGERKLNLYGKRFLSIITVHES
jgi:ATP-dependent DNA helicase RecQ